MAGHLIVGFIYIIISIFGLIGNGLLISSLALVLKIPSMTEVFLCNLAMADFIFVATLPFLATSLFFRDFIFGILGCKILTGLLYMSMYNSAYTVCALSIDRFLAVTYPLRMRKFRTRFHALLITIFLWLFSFLCAAPTSYFSRITFRIRSSETCVSEMKRNFNDSIRELDSHAPIEESFDFQDIPECTERLCSPDFGKSRFWDFYYYLVRMGVSFLIPLVIMIFCNVGMIRALMVVVRTQSLRARTRKTFVGARKRRITKFAILIVFCFLVCWAPVNISNIISDFGRGQPSSFSAPLTEGVSGMKSGTQGGVGLWHLATTCVLYLNTILNPLIYSLSGTSLRHRILNSIRVKSKSGRSVIVGNQLGQTDVREEADPVLTATKTI